MQLIDLQGRPLTVQSQQAAGWTATVYNIEVHEHHTYHVGELGVWVHNANCCEVTQANAIKPSDGGNLSKTKLGQGSITLEPPAIMSPAIEDIRINGDFTGVKTENLVNKTLEMDSNVTILSGTKYAGENGLDHVIQFVDPADGITKTMVIDSKQLAKNGSTSLDPKAAGGVMQLSDQSLEVVVDRLNGSPAGKAVRDAMDNGTLVKAVAYVDKTTGELKIVRVEVPKKKP